MRKTLFALIASFSFLFSNAQQKEIKTSSSIEEVTVFLSGAQITREARVNLRPGTNLIKLSDLTNNLDPNSIQVSGDKKVTIVSVNHQFNYLEEPKKSKRYNEVKDSLDDVNLKLQLRRSIKQVYVEEKNLLLTNKSIGGQQSGVDVEDLMEMADYFRERLKDIEVKLLDAQIEERELSQLSQKLQQQLNQLNGQRHKNTSEVLVNISSKTTTSASLTISYHVRNAGWIPFYDIRSNSIGGPVDLTYKANVYQTTGYDWNNVDITLSTGNPSVNNTRPTVNPWILQYYSPSYGYDTRSNSYYDYAPAAQMDEVAVEEVQIKGQRRAKKEDKSLSLSNFSQVVQAGVNTEFKIKVPYSVATDGNASAIEIQKYELDAGYTYYTAPKYRKEAFLMADVTGWGDLNLLPGQSSIFYEGTYVGKSFLDPNITDDTLQLSMGIDKGIVVERNKISEMCKDVTIGSNNKTTMGFELVVRNTKNKAIEIVVEDQIPISRMKEVVVTMDSKTGNPEYDEKTGIMKWRLKLEPGATVKNQFQYTVKHPKDRPLSNL